MIPLSIEWKFVELYYQDCHSNGRMKFSDFSLIFPDVFKKNSSPAIYVHIGDRQSMQNEIKNTLQANS